ncbi:MAG: hypothetical protein UX02_C0002G0286 [Candidatus Moranbacteria bacterium GW2011_GWC1_45_18]|nr:MAG: hypothetical protein UT79_C0001G0175 [Candidatus Moranbacteria bacterium GW2011_GWC2_40_12]KKT32974.1 MAG: hypothetical protein UW19_C0013G0015 [Candidatus Moranbacteria bacterium GW2011_GWF2_44_10]KKT69739.1 MAG: hypothetical protein UW66_C0063G0004 [Candidatus Moranbacteria bacterium GW2011_GWF1_44_4]KKT99967.1 MAG: hypothetical protein UX02_C0002G0286 [Candidatus Moranbacteria bacterium GW2011_GWC1_45_18]
MVFERGFVVHLFGCDNPHIRLGRIYFNQFRNRLFERIWRNENAVLELQEFEFAQMLAQNIAEKAVFFRNIKKDDSLFAVPALWFFEIYRISQKIKDSCFALSSRSENQLE